MQFDTYVNIKLHIFLISCEYSITLFAHWCQSQNVDGNQISYIQSGISRISPYGKRGHLTNNTGILSVLLVGNGVSSSPLPLSAVDILSALHVGGRNLFGSAQTSSGGTPLVFLLFFCVSCAVFFSLAST